MTTTEARPSPSGRGSSKTELTEMSWDPITRIVRTLFP
jgi:hypothetical protein